MLADHDVRVGVRENMIGADIGGLIEPETGDLSQNLPF